MTKARKISSVPDWFSLSRYQYVAEFTSREWWFHLAGIRQAFDSLEEEWPPNHYKDFVEPNFVPGGVYLPHKKRSLNTKESHQKLDTVVTDVSVFTTLEWAQKILSEPKYKESWEKWNASESDDALSVIEESLNDLRLYRHHDYSYAEVDIGAPEALAVQAFRKWFRAEQEKRKLKKPKGGAISKADLMK
jgi:hypothetical protein